VINVICHINSDVSCPESIFHFLSAHDRARPTDWLTCRRFGLNEIP
jgi:hypothetical protein